MYLSISCHGFWLFSDEDKSTGIWISAAYEINGQAQKDFVLPLKFKSLTTKEKHQIPVNNVWICETPIYVAEAKKPIPRDFFPKSIVLYEIILVKNL
jgi:hypothetical protein